MALDDRLHPLEVAGEQRAQRLRVEPLAEGGRAGEVAEEDRDDLALLLRGRGRRQRSPALLAELRGGAGLVAAGGAGRHRPRLERGRLGAQAPRARPKGRAPRAGPPRRRRPRRPCAGAPGRARREATSCPCRRGRARPGRSTSTVTAARATPTERPTPNCFTVGSPFSTKLPNTTIMISAAATITARRPAGRARIASRSSAPSRAVLLDLARSGTPGSPSRARTAPRTSSAARSSRSGTVPLAASRPTRLRPQPFWKTAVSTPNAAVTDSTLATAAWSGEEERAEGGAAGCRS